MIALFGLLIIVSLSIIAVRIGAIALELTGLSTEIASFQAQSAFSGAGFTTTESEAMVTHPVRRRIIRILILMGSAGVTTSIATLVITFVGQTGRGVIVRGQFLLIGLLCIFLFARSRHLYKIMKVIITKALKKWTNLRVYDYEQLFGLEQGYAIAKISMRQNNPWRNKPIKDLKLHLEDLLILAVYRKTAGKMHFIGAPNGDFILKVNDELICYAKEDTISKKLSAVM